MELTAAHEGLILELAPAILGRLRELNAQPTEGNVQAALLHVLEARTRVLDRLIVDPDARKALLRVVYHRARGEGELEQEALGELVGVLV